MENFYVIIFVGFILTVILVITFKVFRLLYKFNKLYNYFIKSKLYQEEYKKTNFSIKREGIPPINGECPTKEELNNLE